MTSLLTVESGLLSLLVLFVKGREAAAAELRARCRGPSGAISRLARGPGILVVNVLELEFEMVSEKVSPCACGVNKVCY